ncbi:hypothetical protein [Auraticoccus monumenti]|uniref:Uncharacterized protein n=1 Tax=Auraticoccus monumenti TaxID=675864 RepID=A0A1G7BSU7_9ACTN|nr:hypothetical protein [Auraticoccus monumenti]SDE30139.1 hypothetical protein SAMN04489747_3057 [Auraticoccus monumenti]
MPAPRTRPAVLVASGLAALGACLASLAVHLLTLANVAHASRAVFLQAPVVFPYLRARGAVSVLTFLLGLLLVAAVVALVTWLGARSASRERGAAAVALSAWLGTVLGGCLSGAVSGLAFLLQLNRSVPPELVVQQLTGSFSSGAHWGVTEGWLVAVVAAVVFALTNRTRPGVGAAGRVPGSPAPGRGTAAEQPPAPPR